MEMPKDRGRAEAARQAKWTADSAQGRSAGAVSDWSAGRFAFGYGQDRRQPWRGRGRQRRRTGCG
jgi:hypothetical protein